MLTQMMQSLIAWSVQLVSLLGYPGIVFLMFLESSFFPFPSELVMPQAGYLASQGRMNLALVIVMGVIGSWLGALLNYFLALRLGRPFFLKYGKYFFCPPDKFLKVERFFVTHGEIGTFTGRLIPVVRHLISIPAGLAHMKMSHFLLYTGVGSAIWVSILAVIGYVAGENVELIKKYSHQATICVVFVCVLIVLVYVWWHQRKKRAAAGQSLPPAA
jgi:membrane protein DedA with SNARE-associated domain